MEVAMKQQILCIYGFFYRKNIDLEIIGNSITLTALPHSSKPTNNTLYLNMYSYIDQQNVAALHHSMLEEILTFVNQGQVIVEMYNFELLEDEPDISKIAKDPRLSKVTLHKEYVSTGRLVKDENVPKLINSLLKTQTPDRVFLEKLLIVNSERFNMKKYYMDINYLIMMVGLESVAREKNNVFTNKNLGRVLSDFLSNYGFGMVEEDLSNKMISGKTYAHLRNGIAHNGRIFKDVNHHGVIHRYELEEYYSNFVCIFCLLILKMSNYQDVEINWDCWKYKTPMRHWWTV